MSPFLPSLEPAASFPCDSRSDTANLQRRWCSAPTFSLHSLLSQALYLTAGILSSYLLPTDNMAGVSSSSQNKSLLLFLSLDSEASHRPVTWCLDFMSDKPGMYNPCASRSPCDPFPQTSAVTIAVHQAHTRTHKTRINCSCSCWVLSPSLYFAPGDREISKTPCLLPFLPSASVARSG